MAKAKESLILYTNYDSSPTWRVRIALAFKGINYQRYFHSFHEPLDEKYLKVNSLGQIPTLLVDDEIFTQSMAIIEYLEEKYPTPQLLPTDLLMRTKSREIAEVVNSGMQPLHNYFFTVYGETTEYHRASKVHVEKGLNHIECILEKTSGGRYCVGDEISIADVFLFPELYRAIEYGIDLEKYPKVNMVWNTLKNVDVFMICHPNNEPDCPAKKT